MHHDPLSTFVPSVCDPVSSLWRRVRRGTRLLRRLPVWDRFAGEDWPDRVMSEAVTDRLHEKQGRSIGRRVFDHDGETLSVYLKRHYRLPRLHGILATLFPDSAWSPGLQEWQHLAWAKEQGFPVPRAVAAGQFVGPWGRLKGFLVVEELHDMLPLHEAVPLAFQRLDAVTFANWKRGLIGELARLARELHRRRAFHKDLYFCHFYIAEADTRRVPESWTNRAVMIDLHAHFGEPGAEYKETIESGTRAAAHTSTTSAAVWRIVNSCRIPCTSSARMNRPRNEMSSSSAQRSSRPMAFNNASHCGMVTVVMPT